MYQRSVVIQNQSGLHARPASEFVRCASGFRSRITIGRADSGESANAKSIVMLLALALVRGTEVTITARGEDEEAAVDALVALISSGFGE